MGNSQSTTVAAVLATILATGCAAQPAVVPSGDAAGSVDVPRASAGEASNADGLDPLTGRVALEHTIDLATSASTRATDGEVLVTVPWSAVDGIAGVPGEDGEVVFGSSCVARTADGRVALGDSTTDEVVVVDADGALERWPLPDEAGELQRLARSGDDIVVSAHVLGNADTPQKPTLTAFSADGTPRLLATYDVPVSGELITGDDHPWLRLVAPSASAMEEWRVDTAAPREPNPGGAMVTQSGVLEIEDAGPLSSAVTLRASELELRVELTGVADVRVRGDRMDVIGRAPRDPGDSTNETLTPYLVEVSPDGLERLIWFELEDEVEDAGCAHQLAFDGEDAVLATDLSASGVTVTRYVQR